MRSRNLFPLALFPLALAALALVLAAAPALAHEGVAASPAEQQRIHLDLDADADINSGWECTDWHELYPVECTIRHLDKIEGDGELKACNHAWFDGKRYHIDWVGPTYFLDCNGVVAEPSSIEPSEDGDPTGEVWHEIKPNYCDEHVVIDWEDNGNGYLDECDFVTFDNGDRCHIYDIGLDIIISPAPVPIGTDDEEPIDP